MDIKNELNILFPNLPSDFNCEILSNNKGLLFNCVSYSLDIYDEWMWTNEICWSYSSVPRTPVVSSYIKLYEYYGYKECNNGLYEELYEKIAFYALNSIPKHGCKQRGNMWLSKIGELPVILEHKIEWLINNDISNTFAYGDVVFYMKRKIKKG